MGIGGRPINDQKGQSERKRGDTRGARNSTDAREKGAALEKQGGPEEGKERSAGREGGANEHVGAEGA